MHRVNSLDRKTEHLELISVTIYKVEQGIMGEELVDADVARLVPLQRDACWFMLAKIVFPVLPGATDPFLSADSKQTRSMVEACKEQIEHRSVMVNNLPLLMSLRRVAH